MAEIKGNERELQWTILAAFRYCSNRHQTQAMRGIDTVILDNLPLVGTAFLKQMINDIEWEQRAQAIDEEEQGKEKFDYFYRLKAHVDDYISSLKDERGENAQKLYNLLREVMEVIPTVKLERDITKECWWRQVEDTNYLTPLLNKLREEVGRRKANGDY